MKLARGANGISGGADDEEDFKVVPVESVSEYETLQIHIFRGRSIQSAFLFILNCVSFLFCMICVRLVAQVRKPGSWMRRVWPWAVRSLRQRREPEI